MTFHGISPYPMTLRSIGALEKPQRERKKSKEKPNTGLVKWFDGRVEALEGCNTIFENDLMKKWLGRREMRWILIS